MMTNAEWCIKNSIPFKSLCCESSLDSKYELIGYYDYDGDFNILYKGKQLGTLVSESILTWLDMEHKEPVLSDEERNYLSTVIEPFKSRIKYITKEVTVNGERLHFELTNDAFSLPYFRAYTRYHNMMLYARYTLEELGL